MSIMSRIAAITILIALVPLTAPVGLCQPYPSRAVHFIVPFTPGGGTDALARIVGAKVSKSWRQQIIVDNRAGAQGNIGTALGARAAPDGYTITLAIVGTLAINPHLYSAPGFDALNDFAAITRGTKDAWILVVHPSVPAKSMKELAALAKRNPDQLSFASTSSALQLVGELFKLATETRILHVPYKGSAPAVIDLLAGNIAIMFSNPAGVVAHVKAGKLRALAIIGHERLDALPQIPSAVEAGFPELDVYGWYGVVAPRATPRDIVTKLNADFVQALNSSEVREKMSATGQIVAPSTPEEFQALIRADYDRWGKVVLAAGAKVE
jgi:tripartite-type tricarboxylate transporter receptor subunit TctC